MELVEANEIIAEFMEYTLSECGMYWESDKYASISIGYEPEWSDSLDALVPVWEKAKIRNVAEFEFWFLNGTYTFQIFFDRGELENTRIEVREETLQEAACIATAVALKELE